jgi:hypothetical protein
MDTLDKIDKYIVNNDDEYDDAIVEKMFDFLSNLDPEQVPENLVDDYVDIIDELAGEDDDDVDEDFARKKVKISVADKRKRKMAYRKNRAQLKLRAKKYRRTTKYKQYKRKAARKAKQGKTSTGKRQRSFL